MPLRVELLEDERTPDGMVCMGTYRNDRFVARCALPAEAWAKVQEHGFFEQPVPVVLVAREAPPGLQCQLFAMVVAAGRTRDSTRTTMTKNRGPRVCRAPATRPRCPGARRSEEDDGDPRVAPIPLGTIVRFAKDRVHPDSLPLEAADVLRKVIEGKTSEVVDRALEDLLGGGGTTEREGVSGKR